jgi:hypothetical protein
MLVVPAPAAFEGFLLAEEIDAKLGRTGTEVVYDPEENALHITAAEAERRTVEEILAAHKPSPPPPDPDEEFRAAVTAAQTLEDLKAALLGALGRGCPWP